MKVYFFGGPLDGKSKLVDEIKPVIIAIDYNKRETKKSIWDEPCENLLIKEIEYFPTRFKAGSEEFIFYSVKTMSSVEIIYSLLHKYFKQ